MRLLLAAGPSGQMKTTCRNSYIIIIIISLNINTPPGEVLTCASQSVPKTSDPSVQHVCVGGYVGKIRTVETCILLTRGLVHKKIRRLGVADGCVPG